MFVKYNMLRYKNFTTGCIKAFEVTVHIARPKENTSFSAKVKFVAVAGAEIGETRTTKNFNSRKIRCLFEEFFKM